MKIKLGQVLKGILVVILFFTLMYVISYYNEIKFAEETNKVNFKGRISVKYNDKNDHNRPKIEIQCNTETIVYDLETEMSGLFEYVNKGDSIEKLSNSIDVRVFSSSKDTTFRLDF